MLIQNEPFLPSVTLIGGCAGFHDVDDVTSTPGSPSHTSWDIACDCVADVSAGSRYEIEINK